MYRKKTDTLPEKIKILRFIIEEKDFRNTTGFHVFKNNAHLNPYTSP